MMLECTTVMIYLLGTNTSPKMANFEDDVVFPKVRWVSFLEGIYFHFEFA